MVHRSTPENRPKDPDNLTPAALSSNQPNGLKTRYETAQVRSASALDLESDRESRRSLSPARD
jgi:hypothetical protein